jgi:hypothetical protein
MLLRRIGLVAAFVVASSLVARAARADIKVWDDHPDDPNLHRDLWIGGYIQPGFIWRQNDPSGQNPYQDDVFWVQRARISVHSQLQRYIFARIEYDGAVNALEDAYVDGRFIPQINVRFGQYQIPFLRTYLFSDSQLGFNDRVLYTPQDQDRSVIPFLTARDIGWELYGTVPLTPYAVAPVIQYWAGMYLGKGQNQKTNFADSVYMFTGRVQVDILGVPDGAEAESDLARNKVPRVSVGGGVYTNCDDLQLWDRGWTSDLEFRYQGLFASASMVWFKEGPSSGLGNFLGYKNDCKAQPGVGPQIASGGSAQLQYVLPEFISGPDRSFEVAVRWDQVNPRSPCNEDTGACSFFGGDASTPGYQVPTGYTGTDGNPPSRYRVTFGINFYPNNRQNLRLSLDYFLNRETENVVSSNGTFVGIKNDAIWFQMTAGL